MENAITDINIVERKLLANIKRHPGMYIGKMSLEFLQNFFNGYNLSFRFLIFFTSDQRYKQKNNKDFT